VLQFDLSLNIDIAEEEVQSSINARRAFCPRTFRRRRFIARPIRGCSRSHAGHHIQLHSTFSGRGSGGYAPCAQALAVERCRPGEHQRRTKAGRAHSGQSDGAVVLRTKSRDLRTALAQTSVNAAKGNFDGPHQDYQINANDQLVTSGDYRKVVVAYRNGAPVM